MIREEWLVILAELQMKTFYGSKLKFISLMTAAFLTITFSLDQTGWAATIIACSGTVEACNGTSGDDIIIGGGSPRNIIHGLGGNDWIVGNGPAADLIFGDDGNDILYGTELNDSLQGGRGNDKYDGWLGNDTIIDLSWFESPFVPNDDVISGNWGDDYIESGFGSDKIQGGPGNDLIYPGGFERDFSLDTTNCGSGTNDRILAYTGDGDTFINCESVTDMDR
jgi:Ca2+-binding RTX toxin-like protein